MRYFFWLTLCAFSVHITPARAAVINGELPRGGAPRPLRLISSDGAPLAGLPSDVAWERRGQGVFFTLERGGTRNIWRAFPDPQDASRFPAWRALPVTDLRAPSYAAQPCPLPGDRALACVSNALAKAPQSSQIVRYDIAGARWTALSDGVRLYDSPQVSPDGARVAFAGGPGLSSQVFVASTSNPANRIAPDVTAVVERARRPIWLDNGALLIENMAPNARGLYWTPLSVPLPRMIVGGGGEANALGENGIVFSAKTGPNTPPNLYLIARDGSGLRQLNETAGARRPATSPDGQMLAFDAPAQNGRALWVLPLLRADREIAASAAGAINAVGARAQPRAHLVADDGEVYDGPAAQLSSVRASSEGVAILGTLRGSSNSLVTLEVGQGEKPRRWEKLDAPFPPLSPPLDTAGNRVLALWKPSPRARGIWTLRLSLSGLGGGAQSLLRVKLPLPAQPLLPPLPELKKVGSPREIPLETSDELPLPRATPLPIPPEPMVVRDSFTPPLSTDAGANLPIFPPMPMPETLAIPPIVMPPTITAPPAIPAKTPTTLQMPIVPIEPMRVPRRAAPSGVRPDVELPTSPPPIVPNNAMDGGDYGAEIMATGEPFVAQFNVSGTPARAKPGEKLKVTFWGLNRGSSAWETGNSGDGRVRVVARWIDFSTGTRRQWNYFWLSDAVASGERTKRELELLAPTQPGRYKLIYGLVKLPATGEFSPPAYNAPQESWDGEFGAIAFAIQVGEVKE